MPNPVPLDRSIIPGAPSRLDLQELFNVAVKARGPPSQSCRLSSNRVQSGQFNITLAIAFNDGVEWIAKCPRTEAFANHPEIRKLKLESEVATLQLVKESTTIPVPTVFAWNSSDDNPVGSAYILMSRAEGQILDHCGWYRCNSKDGRGMTQEQKSKIYSHLARFIYELSSLRFSKIGSIFRGDDGVFFVGECLRISTVEYGRVDRGVPRGPFASAKEYYSLLADVQSHEIWDPNLYLIGSFFDPLPRWADWPEGYKDQGYREAIKEWNIRAERDGETIENKLDYRIFADILREMIDDMPMTTTTGDMFPLEHGDLGAQNIFVDNDFNITSIIDWDLCSTVPLETLITHPSLPSRSFEVDMTGQDAFQIAFEQEDRKGDPDCRLTTILRSSQERRDFDRFLHKDELIDDCARFERLFRWKYGAKDMKEYFAERKNTRRYLEIREKLEE